LVLPFDARAVEDTRDDADIARAGQAYLDFIVSVSPERATLLGLHGHDEELDDRRTATFFANLASEERMLDGLRARFPAPRASRSARTDLEILEHALATDLRVKRERRPLETQPALYEAPLDGLFETTARGDAPASERASHVLSRLVQIPRVIAEAKGNLRHPPRVWTEMAIARAKGVGIDFDALRAGLLLALPSDQAKVLRAIDVARAAYADYASFLEKDLLPRSTGEYAAGPDLFAFMLGEGERPEEGTSELTALGQRVLAETIDQMTMLTKKIDPSAATWFELALRLEASRATLPRSSYPEEVSRAKAFLAARDVVPLPRGDTYDVIDAPLFERALTNAVYDPPPQFGKETRGLLLVGASSPRLPKESEEPTLGDGDGENLVGVVVRETYPGRLLQRAFQRLYPSVIRKVIRSSAFEGGWVFYAEELMNELGYYTDEERLMELRDTLMRAALALIDLGLHARTMTFDEAVALLVDTVHVRKDQALSEVRRCTLEPTVSLSYLMARESIRDLRERYRLEEKDRFSLERFHADVLSRGGIAPRLLAEEMFER